MGSKTTMAVGLGIDEKKACGAQPWVRRHHGRREGWCCPTMGPAEAGLHGGRWPDAMGSKTTMAVGLGID